MECSTLHVRGMVSSVAAKALSNFLADTHDLEEHWARYLVIDDAKLNDQGFQLILEGIKAQGPHLASFTCHDSVLSPRSLNHLIHFLPSLTELSLKNVTFENFPNEAEARHSRPGSQSLPTSPISELSPSSLGFLKAMEQRSGKLLKLQLSKLDLGADDEAFRALCSFITNSGTVAYFGLSWANLKGRHLKSLTQAFLQSPASIRQIDLSYNRQQFSVQGNVPARRVQEKAIKESEGFVRDFAQYLAGSESELLNHINLSGMGLEPDHLRVLCRALSKKPNLLCVHLDGNEINTMGPDGMQSQLYQDIFEMFEVDKEP